jgi:hypothetical protein
MSGLAVPGFRHSGIVSAERDSNLDVCCKGRDSCFVGVYENERLLKWWMPKFGRKLKQLQLPNPAVFRITCFAQSFPIICLSTIVHLPSSGGGGGGRGCRDPEADPDQHPNHLSFSNFSQSFIVPSAIHPQIEI